VKRSANQTVLVAAVLFTVLLSACSSSQIVASLEAVVAAAELAVPVIGAAGGIPPQTSAVIVSYLQAVGLATGKASVILAGTGTAAEKSAAIVAAFAQVAALNLPPGTPAEIVAVINGVSQAVINFLSPFNPPATAARVGLNWKLSGRDKAKLADLKARSDEISKVRVKR
jgi:hypothetical protein